MKWLKDEKGSALAYVLVVLVVSSVLVGGIITVAQSENYQAIYQHKYTKAYYIARAGAESMAQVMLKMEPQYLSEFITQQEIKEIPNALGTGGDLNVTVVEDDDPNTPYIEYKVTGEGTYQGVKASAKIILSYGEYNYAEYSSFSLEDMTGDDKDDSKKDIGIGNLLGVLASEKDVLQPANIKDEDLVKFIDGASFPHPVPKIPNISEVEADSFDYLYLIDVDDDGEDLSEIDVDDDGEDLSITDSTLIRYTGSGNNEINSITINSGTLEELTGDYYYRKDYNISTGFFNLTDIPSESDKPDYPIVVIYLEDYFVINQIDIYGDKPVIFVLKDSLQISGSLFIHSDASILIYIDNEGSELLFNGGNNTYVGKFVNYINPEASANTEAELLALYNELQPMFRNLNITSLKDVKLQLDINGVISADIILPNGTFEANNGQTYVFGTSFAKKVIITSSVDFLQPSDGGEGTFFSQDEMHISYWLD